MAESNIYKIVYLLFVTSATTGIVPSLKPYDERTWDENRICHVLGKKGETFQLSSARNASVIIRPSYNYNVWHSPCRFVFKMGPQQSLMVVIQSMYLRIKGNRCLDYVEFKRKDGQVRAFCGEIDRERNVFRVIQRFNDEWQDIKNELDDFGDYDSDGKIETTVVRSNVPLEPDDKIDLTVVYTPYRDCTSIRSYVEDYRAVQVSAVSSDLQPIQMCIWKEYFCDGYVNCINTLCRDEEGCERGMDIVSNGTGTKVTIGAVTTMLLCFIIFIMGLWICRKHKKMCWSPDCAGPSGHDNRLPRAEREAADNANPSVAVSPMLEFVVPSSVPNKDLPPSYDSLFPEQSNPSTT